jgi:hypothetical protein
MRYLFKWLKPERPSGVALHPSRTVELDVPPAQAFARCIEGVEHLLGGIVRESDADRGRIEATFGLVDSERISVSVTPLEEERSRVLIESRRGALAGPAKPSQYVKALAEFLQC